MAHAVNSTSPTVDALAADAPALANGGAGLPSEALPTPLLMALRRSAASDAVQFGVSKLLAAAAASGVVGADTMLTYAGTDLANATTAWIAASLDFQAAAGIAQYHSMAVDLAGGSLQAAESLLQALPTNATNASGPAFYDAMDSGLAAVHAFRQVGSGVLLRDLYAEVVEFQTLSLSPFSAEFPTVPYSQSVKSIAETLSQDEQSQLGQFSGQKMWAMLDIPQAAEPEKFAQLNATGTALFNLPAPPHAGASGEASALGSLRNGSTGFSGTRLLWAQAYLVGGVNVTDAAALGEGNSTISAGNGMVTLELRQLG